MSSRCFKRREQLIWERFDDETVVVDTRAHKSYVLNASGAYVWRHCDGRTSLQEIAARLDAPAGREEAEAFCAELREKGLLEEVPADTEREAVRKMPRFAAPYVSPAVRLEELADNPTNKPGKRDIGGSRP
ncbi:MAG: PqqD family protein [Planctomycetota bacterium]|nr:PqqD family protein [Planctomycetota bacterium]